MNIFSNKSNVITYTVNKVATNNLYISVQNGEVIINAPWYTTSTEIQKIVEEKRKWIINKIEEYQKNYGDKKQYTKIKNIKVLGEDYKLVVEYKNVKIPELKIENKEIQVKLPHIYKKMQNPDAIEVIINKMYEKIAEKEIERAMEKTRILLEIAPEDYEIKRLENRKILAVCKDKKITVNPDIVMYSRDIIDYIVLHEFCHLKYKNHTKSFYNMLKTYMPDYEEKVKELNGIAY